jgi:hypothetical protein
VTIKVNATNKSDSSESLNCASFQVHNSSYGNRELTKVVSATVLQNPEDSLPKWRISLLLHIGGTP